MIFLVYEPLLYPLVIIPSSLSESVHFSLSSFSVAVFTPCSIDAVSTGIANHFFEKNNHFLTTGNFFLKSILFWAFLGVRPQ